MIKAINTETVCNYTKKISFCKTVIVTLIAEREQNLGATARTIDDALHSAHLRGAYLNLHLFYILLGLLKAVEEMYTIK